MTNSRNKGNSYERQIAKELRELGFEKCITSRAGSKVMDDAGIDLLFTHPWLIQCKNYAKYNPAEIIKRIKNMKNTQKDMSHIINDSDVPTFFLKLTGKGEIICIDKKDFYRIMQIISGYCQANI